MTCTATLVCTERSSRRAGDPCTEPATHTADGSPLCWVHARAVQNGVRSLDDVLAGRSVSGQAGVFG